MQGITSVEPKWGSRRWILDRYGLPVRAFDRAVAEGLVRSCKFGQSQQAARLFLVADVERFMLAIAAGRTPQRVVGGIR